MSQLHLITGCMFSGKTSHLMEVYNELRGEAVILKPLLDSRSKRNTIESHNSVLLECLDIDSIISLEPDILNKADHILIDETQFFGPDDHSAMMKLLESGKIIYAAGLLNDFQDKPFEIMDRIRRTADSVTVLFARCQVCGSPATHTYRTGDSSQLYLPGGSEMYEARCANCFKL